MGLVLHCTKKLCTRLHIPELAPADRACAGPHLRWYANVFTAGRMQYVLTTNAASLYSVVLAEEDLRDARAYFRAFLGALAAQMKADGLAAVYDGVIAPAAGEMVLAKTADRSVLGTMKLMAQECAIGVAYVDASPAELSERINGNLYRMHGRETPRDAFARLALEENRP